MFMASYSSENGSILIKNGSDRFKACCIGPTCIQEPIKVDKFGNVSFENRQFDQNILAAHLKKHHVIEPLKELAIVASKDTDSRKVVLLSDFLKGHFPELQVSWSVDKET